MGLGMLKPKVIWKNQPRPILAFITAVRLGKSMFFSFPYIEKSENKGTQGACL